MSELKSAWELASERIIAPPQKPREEPSLSSIPEFVSDWTSPDGEPDEKEFTDAFIDQEEPDSKVAISQEDRDRGQSIRVQEPERICMEDLMEIHWNGNFFDYGGFARMNRTMAFGLSNRNVKVKLDINPYLNHVNQATREKLESMAKTKVSPDATKVYGVTIPLNMFHGGKKIIYTMIETSEKVHSDYSEKLNLVDEVWVATHYGKRILESSNVQVPIYVMPLGVDPSRYNPEAGVMDFGQKMRSFKFLSVFRWSYRKGYDILLRAFMEEFSSEYDATLILVSRPVEYAEEIGPQRMMEDFNAIKGTVNKNEEDFPHVVLYPKPVKEYNMPKIYNSADAFVLISRGEGFGLPYCFVRDTPIKTIKGYRGIQDVKNGELVLTDKGHYKKVTETHQNDVKGSFINIKTMLGGNLDVTDNHAFKVVKKPLKKEYRKIGLSNCLEKKDPEWIRAKNLEVGDYLLYPIRKEWIGEHKLRVDVLDYFDQTKIVACDGGKVYNKFSNGLITNSDLARMAKVSKRQVEHFNQDGKIGKEARERIEKVIKTIPIENRKSCVYRYIDVNENFAKLLGYYCAEGNLLSKEAGIEFHFHLEEINYQKEVRFLIKECLGLDATITLKDRKNVASLRVCNSIVAAVFKEMCGNHACNKQIPPLILLTPQKTIQSFLNGYINGDGHSSYNANIVSITTASKKLAMEYQSLMMDQGEHCSLTCDNRGLYNCVIAGNSKVDFIEKDLRHVSKNLRWNVWSDSRYIFIPIVSLSNKIKSQTVFNIDVEDDHCYVAGISVAHNCEAAATGLPVIASNCSGQSDFLNEDNAFVVDPDSYIEASTTGRLSKMAKLCHFYEGQIFPDFGSDAIEKTKEHLRFVFENYQEARDKAEKLRALVVNNYTWDMAVDRVYNRLLEIGDK